ncbi:Jag family protein [Pseudanabaena mucicola]|uniref:RNA-binding protein n=1 Tax=Pseudanabaena mucicola FACHB-723 TaxID=2692860 RepID=A0ABR7ZYH2_9CYAN|nr:R3H domain-containing nucleic acid-binding protein [Pseudanabaena mucicola]MBD2188520.1 RNA-binding protein [Pseudanabaena mucicola FACHB-723]
MDNASTSANWLQELLGLMGYETSVDARIVEALTPKPDPNSQNYWLEINTHTLQDAQIQSLIGKDGAVIDSLQYLASVLLNYPLTTDSESSLDRNLNRNFYTVELDGYQTKRIANLQALADNAVQQVRETGAEFAIKQLSAADRRYIHQLLEEFADISTQSQGKEPNRHLVVKLVQS